MSKVEHVDEKRADSAGPETADTVPGAPAGPRFDDDAPFRELAAFARESREFLAGRGWDNLAHVERFARALALAGDVVSRHDDVDARRACVALIYPLLPERSRARPIPYAPLPDVVMARAPLFALQHGDIPRIAPCYTEFLGRGDVVDRLLVAGAGPFLVSRAVCPGASRGSCSAVMIDSVAPMSPSTAPTTTPSTPPTAQTTSLPPSLASASLKPVPVELRCHVPAALFRDDVAAARATTAPPATPSDDVEVTSFSGHRRSLVAGPSQSLGPDDTPTVTAPDALRGANIDVSPAARIDVRLGPDGTPLLGVDGKPQPLTLTLDQVSSWVFAAGPDARGLDLRRADDRALMLTWAHALRGVDVGGRSAFAALEDANASREERQRAVDAAVACAVDVVARHALDPIACRIVLRSHENDLGWPARAAAFLDETKRCHDVSSRSPATEFARDIVWLDALAPHGFAHGRMTSLAAGRAFARLATSVLAPLGVLPLSGLKDASGDVVIQRLLPVDDGGNVRLAPAELISFDTEGPARSALFDAWKRGRGLALPEPRGCPHHDIDAMPAWLAFFLEGIA